MIYLAYIVLAALVIGVSIKISNYVDLLDKKSNLSGAFIGGVMLAAITSLPELFTSISATVFLNEAGLVLGNVLGSNIFNITILGLVLLISMRSFRNAKIASSHTTTAVLTLIIYLIVFIPAVLGKDMFIMGISIFSILILASYIYGIRKMSADESGDDGGEEVDSDLTIKQILIRFTIASFVLVLVSIFITLATDVIAEKLNLGATVAGALFLGIATSLPEVAATFALLKLGNFNAMFGNILGSNLFNFTILFVGDALYRGGTIYLVNSQSFALMIFGITNTLCILAILQAKLGSYSDKSKKMVYIISGCLTLVGYGMFLMMSM